MRAAVVIQTMGFTLADPPVSAGIALFICRGPGDCCDRRSTS
jgi:hypothetical protein